MSERIQEIIKSLRLCTNGTMCHPDCSFFGLLQNHRGCREILMKEAASLLERLQLELAAQDAQLKDYDPFPVFGKAEDVPTDVVDTLMANEKELRDWIVRCAWHCQKVHDQSRKIADLAARAESAEREFKAAFRDLLLVASCVVCSSFKDRSGFCSECDGVNKFKWRGSQPKGEVTI